MLTRGLLRPVASLLLLALAAPLAWSQEPSVDLGATDLVILDFETEAQADLLVAEDSARTEDPEADALVHVFRSGLGAPQVGGERSLYIRFGNCDDGWARGRTKVDGDAWTAEEAGEISCWLNCYVAARTVGLALADADGVEYRTTVDLPSGDWAEVKVAFESFVAEDGSKASDHVDQLRELVFFQEGAWDECTFRIDQVSVSPREGGADVVPDTPDVPGTTPPDEATDPGTPDVTPPGTGQADVVPPANAYDFRADVSYATATDFYFRPYLGANAVPGDEANLENPAVVTLVRDLEPMIRVKVTVPASASDDADTVAALKARVAAVSAVAKERGVMVAVAASMDTVSADRFAAFCEQLVRALNSGPENKRVRYWELLDSPVLLTDAAYRSACQMVNSAVKKMLAVDPDVRAGGMSFYAAQKGPMDRVLRGTKGAVKFVSWHFYGAGMLSAPDTELFRAADSGVAYGIPDVIGPTAVVELLKVGDLYENGLLFVTECNLNNVKTPDGRCQDPRGASPMAGAWLASYLATVGALVDVVLVSELFGDSWGMVTPDGQAGPVYWTARLFKDHFPRGAQICPSRSTSGTELRTLGATVENRKLLLLINRKDKPANVEVVCEGVARGAEAVLYSVGAGEGIAETPVPLEFVARRTPRSPEGEAAAGARPGADAVAHNVVLAPYGVAILEIGAGPSRTP